MAGTTTVYRNYTDSDSTNIELLDALLPPINAVEDAFGETYDWSRTGYTFLGWNSARDGSGTTYQAGSMPPSGSYYAQWQAAVVTTDVTISYNGSTITTMNASGTEVLETNGKICAADITVEYNKPTPNLQAKSNISPSTSSQTITADGGYDGLSSVQINAMQTMTLPSSTSNSSSGTSRATIAASTSTRYLNIPKGYNSTARYYTLSAISPTKSAQTYTPTTSDQTISSGRWLSGNQTIKGDANLLAGNIKKDVSIFGVTGTYEGGGGGGGQLYIFTEAPFVNCGAEINGLNIPPKAVFYNGSVTQGATVTFHTYGDYILDSITGETSGTTISFNTISRGNYTFTMPNESVYCALLYDD